MDGKTKQCSTSHIVDYLCTCIYIIEASFSFVSIFIFYIHCSYIPTTTHINCSYLYLYQEQTTILNILHHVERKYTGANQMENNSYRLFVWVWISLYSRLQRMQRLLWSKRQGWRRYSSLPSAGEASGTDSPCLGQSSWSFEKRSGA